MDCKLSGPGVFLFAAALAAAPLRAEIAVVATDNKLVLVDGADVVVRNPAPDTFGIVDLSAFPPRLVSEIGGVPTSVIGPPLSLAVTPDESVALDTSCMKVDPDDPTKQTFDHRMSVLDLRGPTPRVRATLTTGLGPTGVSINRRGTLALVADRGEGSVSIFTIRGRNVAPAGKLAIGNAASALAHVAFTPDGRRALVTRDGDNLVTFLNVDGAAVTLAGVDLRTGSRPYGIDVSGDGRIAVVANDGGGTVSVIDLRGPPHVTQTIAVGSTPEGIKLSPDGKLCAVVVENGSTKPKDSPAFHDYGLLVLFRVEGVKLVPAGVARIGHWSQGVAFSADDRAILVCNMVEKDLQVLEWDGAALRDHGLSIGLGGGPVAIRTADH